MPLDGLTAANLFEWLVSTKKHNLKVVAGKLKACGVTGALFATFDHKDDLTSYGMSAYEASVLLALKNRALKNKIPLSTRGSASNGTSLHSLSMHVENNHPVWYLQVQLLLSAVETNGSTIYIQMNSILSILCF